MIWDAIADFGERHPTTIRRVTAMIFLCLLAYAILGGITSLLVEQGRDGCERGNAARLVDFRRATAEKANAEVQAAIYRGRHDESLYEAWEQRVTNAEKQMEGIVGIAEASGHQTTFGAVTISCPEAWPKPIPWFGEA